MNADRKTLSVYDAKVADYVKLAVGDDFSNRHTRKAAFPQHLETLHKALKPDDLFHIGMKLGRVRRGTGSGVFMPITGKRN